MARRARPRPLAARGARDRLALQRRLRARGLLLVRERDRGLHGDSAAGRLRAAGARRAAPAAAAAWSSRGRASWRARRGARAARGARGGAALRGRRVGVAQAARRHHRPRALRLAADPTGGRPRGRARSQLRAPAGERVRARGGPGARDAAARPLRARLARARAPAAIAAAIVLALTGYGALPPRPARARRPPPGRCSRPASCRPTSAATASSPASWEPTTPRARSSTRTSSSRGRRSRRPRIDLLVWPETVYPTTFGTPKTEAGAALDREIAGFVASSRVPLVFGAYDVDAERRVQRRGLPGAGPRRALRVRDLPQGVALSADRARAAAARSRARARLAPVARHLEAGRGTAGDAARSSRTGGGCAWRR